jgi:N-glycosylase/DNA lyase
MGKGVLLMAEMTDFSRFRKMQAERKRTLLKKAREYRNMLTRYGTLPYMEDIERVIEDIKKIKIQR